jgi:DNA polymerase elongation subunit (family B)
MSTFYTSVIQKSNDLLVRAVENGKRVQYKVRYKPTFYCPTKKKSNLTTLKGTPVESIQLGSIFDARDFLGQYKEQPGLVYGMERYPYVWIAENYEGYVDWSMDKILTLTIDIEVASENGFPDPELADEEVLCITVKNHSSKKIIVWGIYDFNNTRDDVEFIWCIDERDMLDKFVGFMATVKPDIITGWNTTFFDIPYLANRITRLFGEKTRHMMSPWNLVTSEQVQTYGRELTKYIIWGVANMDYMDLYRKFTYKNQESFALDYIANIELGVKKDKNPYDTFKEWYTKDYQSFVEYNIKDVELVDALEDKMKLMELCVTMAYEAKANFIDVFSQVRMWDVTIYNFLRDKNIVVPQRSKHSKGAKYEGAYVKDPIIGQHEWVMSFDLNSLYPHLMMQYNISPETVIEQRFPKAISVDKLLDGEVDTKVLGDKLTVTPNAACFRKDIHGFLPELMETMYGDRVKFKKYALDARRRYEETKDKKYLSEISKYNNIQLARKIALNSAYGAIGNQYFRYYDEKLATAITTSGQLSIRWIENKVNAYLNNLLKTEDEDYIIASDTDSIYVRFDSLIEKVQPKNPIDFLDKVATEKIEPYINKCYEELAEYVNAYQQKMEMSREVIADKGIWTAKKRYILNVHDSEGVRYAEPQLKIMGLEAVKSSTPAACREMIKSALVCIVKDDEKTLNTFIQSFRKNFMKLNVEEIAFPRSVNGIKKWGDRNSVFKKGTPMHIKGAIIYNHLLNRDKLSKKYPLIQDGEKIKYLNLKTPNPVQANVISFLGELPEEFGLHEYIDWDAMFEKSFVDPLDFIVQAIDWQIDRSYGTQRTLESLFG